ncbi:dihydrodipicolinate synthase family protein [Leucobacter denitrificans]|uniref:Dihydrodipicolinate synthase family protein n=1 Tax=Leucobacter denitrificans TaxID=683042 RepID=A0A7G9S5P7_9MICO|nr:dihydrodipicolinate synthase family protein [Leucobacter denitrificans]QNN63172.1 dihydrodipicolinate synthase family protein [Leucobacter denitrificans]
MFRGLSAFPLTPMYQDKVDEPRFVNLIKRLVVAQVDSITVLGSTGAYAYLDRDERVEVVRTAVEHAQGVPVFAGVGALRTSHVLRNAQDAEEAGAKALLLAPVSYQPLTEGDVIGLFEAVAGATDLPIIIYDNPGTTRFRFTYDLYARLARIPNVVAIKIPGALESGDQARNRLAEIRSSVGAEISIGISGDASAAEMLSAGCDTWYSVIGGTFPNAAQSLLRAAQIGGSGQAPSSETLLPVWDLFQKHGSFRAIAALAEESGLAQRSSLPLPIQGLNDEERVAVREVLEQLHLS